jgi:hypothetical protein
MRLAALGLVAVFWAGPVWAAEGNVADFLARANALKAKGAMAVFSAGEIGRMTQQIKAAGAAYRARLAQEKAAGHPSSCPPEKTSLNSNDILAHFASYPEAQRAKIPLSVAMGDLFIRRFPCP